MTPTDAELVARARGGDRQSYAALIERHRASLERYALRLLGEREEAEEALQDTLIRAWAALSQCAEPDRVRGWLFRILVNRCRTRLARANRLVRGAAGDAALASVPAAPRDDGWQEELTRALAALPEEQREAFLLKHVEAFSYEEMAELTGQSVPALKMRVSRACAALRLRLEEVYRGR
ncbi:MAG: RNA polymerase sigma factor [Gemmatimonadetes bacterium]|nr:RNA polymerase sigma factor [Gemmatimonadota bacterium]